MADQNPLELPPERRLPQGLDAIRAQTPARVFMGRSGLAYGTATQMALRQDHAAAVDAVQTELDLERDFGPALIAEFGLFLAQSKAASKGEFLLRPDLGRRLEPASAQTIQERCPREVDVQVVIGDGLSATAAVVQAPPLLPLLRQGAVDRGWSFGRPFVVRHCRVGAMNDIGDLLAPQTLILLIGERPGLATAESLSAYMAFRPKAGHTDAQRNLISNIHRRGLRIEEAAGRILAIVEKMRRLQTSGAGVKEELP